MKNLFYLFIFIVLVSCSTSKFVYWCGDHPCINKKEKEAHFKKTMIVEMKELKDEKFKNNSEIEKITQLPTFEKKNKIKEEKKLSKLAKLEENRRIKQEKELSKLVELDEKKIIKKNTKISKQKVSIVTAFENITIASNEFKKLADRITKNNSFRPYPNINDIPD